VSYRPDLTARALAQFHDLAADPVIYDALMGRILRLADAPWDGWPAYPGGVEPEIRQTQFGEYGLLSYRVDDQAEMLIIFSIIWVG
jgi:hypothetical protein